MAKDLLSSCTIIHKVFIMYTNFNIVELKFIFFLFKQKHRPDDKNTNTYIYPWSIPLKTLLLWFPSGFIANKYVYIWIVYVTMGISHESICILIVLPNSHLEVYSFCICHCSQLIHHSCHLGHQKMYRLGVHFTHNSTNVINLSTSLFGRMNLVTPHLPTSITR